MIENIKRLRIDIRNLERKIQRRKERLSEFKNDYSYGFPGSIIRETADWLEGKIYRMEKVLTVLFRRYLVLRFPLVYVGH